MIYRLPKNVLIFNTQVQNIKKKHFDFLLGEKPKEMNFNFFFRIWNFFFRFLISQKMEIKKTDFYQSKCILGGKFFYHIKKVNMQFFMVFHALHHIARAIRYSTKVKKVTNPNVHMFLATSALSIFRLTDWDLLYLFQH